jgi:hypothetical protein
MFVQTEAVGSLSLASRILQARTLPAPEMLVWLDFLELCHHAITEGPLSFDRRSRRPDAAFGSVARARR